MDAAASLDQEIKRAQDEIKEQLAQRDALSSILLSSQGLAALAPKRTSPLSPGHLSLNQVWTRHTKAKTVHAQRAALGTTVFATTDPDPAAPDGGAVTGIRIERFSHATRRFLAPAYVFLQRTRADGGDDEAQWRVHRHTLPPGVPVHALAAKLLGGGADGADAALRRFARAATREALGLLRRQEAAAALRGKEFREVRVLNGEATEIGLVGRDGAVGGLRVGRTGRVEKVRMPRDGADAAQLARRMAAAADLAAVKELVGGGGAT